LQKSIFIAFLRANLLGYGGGLAAIPLMKNEIVDKYRLLDEETFSDTLALANTLPGPINTKMAGYIGWRIKGFWGMLNAVVATVFPTAILIIILLTTLNSFKDINWVAGMFKGVLPIAGVMIGVLAWDFFKISNQLLGLRYTAILVILSFIIIQLLNIHPAALITGLIIYALTANIRTKDEVRK